MDLVSRCYSIGISITDLKHMSFTMLMDIFEDRIEQNNKLQADMKRQRARKGKSGTSSSRKATQNDIDQFF